MYLNRSDILAATKLNKQKANFEDIVESVTGYKIIKEDKSIAHHRLMRKHLDEAARRVIGKSVTSVDRVNETSPAVQKMVAQELRRVGYVVNSHDSGFPDLAIENFEPISCYVEIKTSEKDPSTLRAFYMSGNIPHIKRDSLHFIMIFKVSSTKSLSDQITLFNTDKYINKYLINKYVIKDIHGLELTLKSEWNCSSKDLHMLGNRGSLCQKISL